MQSDDRCVLMEVLRYKLNKLGCAYTPRAMHSALPYGHTYNTYSALTLM